MTFLAIKAALTSLWSRKREIFVILVIIGLTGYVIFLKSCVPDNDDVIVEKDTFYQKQIDSLVENHKQEALEREQLVNGLMSDLDTANRRYLIAQEELRGKRKNRVNEQATKKPSELTSKLAEKFDLVNLDVQ